MKLWWVHNEAMIATLYAFYITKDQHWWQLFEKVCHVATYGIPLSYASIHVYLRIGFMPCFTLTLLAN